MIKVDLHIHTVPNRYLDCYFEYDSGLMTEYVASNNVKMIAITNHNIFDKNNFLTIEKDLSGLDCVVLPGIEVSLETGHILVIGDNSAQSIGVLEKISSFISSQENDDKYSMSISDFNREVCDKGFLLIPHYLKKPSISQSVLNNVKDTITCGEVKSRKHFVDLMDSDSNVSPVLFSDIRIGLEQDVSFYRDKDRFTFLDMDIANFFNLKRTISNKAFISLTEHGGHKFFDVLGSLVVASTGINVLLGKRSSGKTYLLDSIYNSDKATSLYIKQFQISKESESTTFAAVAKNEHQASIIYHFKDFIALLDYIDELDIDSINLNMGNYVDSLKKHANLNLEDVYSKTALFNYKEISESSITVLEKLTEAANVFLSAPKDYKGEINKYIDDQSLVSLYKYFVSNQKKEALWNKLIKETNDVTKQISQALTLKSTATPICDIDFCSLFRKMYVKQKFNNLISKFKTSIVSKDTVLGEFSKTITVFKSTNKTSLKAVLGVQKSASIDYLTDLAPIDAYQKAKNDSNIKNGSDNFRYRLFFDYQVSITDKYGDDISGGQTAEYLLLNKLIHYHNYDFVLIDEMESSFDNPFLNEKIVELIHDIAKTCTVFISTHNNNLGVSLNPDYYIYHEKQKKDGTVLYKRFCGKATDKHLTNHELEKVKLSEILMETMEANDNAYRERNKKYEDN